MDSRTAFEKSLDNGSWDGRPHIISYLLQVKTKAQNPKPQEETGHKYNLKISFHKKVVKGKIKPSQMSPALV